jgi:hypothetical protein
MAKIEFDPANNRVKVETWRAAHNVCKEATNVDECKETKTNKVHNEYDGDLECEWTRKPKSLVDIQPGPGVSIKPRPGLPRPKECGVKLAGGVGSLIRTKFIGEL